MAFTPPQPLSPFAQHLVIEGLLVEAQARELADQARAEEIPFLLYLEDKKWLDALTLAQNASQFFSLPLYNLDVHQTDKMPIEFMSLEVVKKGFAVPLLRKKNILFFGVADPEPINTTEIAFTTGTQVKLIVVEANKLRTLAADMREAQNVVGIDNTLSDETFAGLNVTAYDEEPQEGEPENVDDKPIVGYINQLLLDAIKIKASDIHFEPFEKYFRIRYRIDGILHEASRSPIQAASTMVARLKVLANLDIAEHRIPLDGRFKITLARDKSVD